MKSTMNILYATDGSPSASAATALLPRLALPPNARVLVATVIREPARPESLRHPDVWDRLMQQMHLEEHEAATDLLARAKKSLIEKNLAARGVSLETRILEGNVPQEIVIAARNLVIDLIVDHGGLTRTIRDPIRSSWQRCPARGRDCSVFGIGGQVHTSWLAQSPSSG